MILEARWGNRTFSVVLEQKMAGETLIFSKKCAVFIAKESLHQGHLASRGVRKGKVEECPSADKATDRGIP
jgi:hypothetical protein